VVINGHNGVANGHNACGSLWYVQAERGRLGMLLMIFSSISEHDFGQGNLLQF